MPDIVVRAIEGQAFDVGGILIASVLMVAATLAALWLDQQGRRTLVGWSRGVAMVLGIWLLGPLLMMVGITLVGTGFTAWPPSESWVLLIPGVAFFMAAYDGSLGALLVVTVLLPAVTWARTSFSSKST